MIEIDHKICHILTEFLANCSTQDFFLVYSLNTRFTRTTNTVKTDKCNLQTASQYLFIPNSGTMLGTGHKVRHSPVPRSHLAGFSGDPQQAPMSCDRHGTSHCEALGYPVRPLYHFVVASCHCHPNRSCPSTREFPMERSHWQAVWPVERHCHLACLTGFYGCHILSKRVVGNQSLGSHQPDIPNRWQVWPGLSHPCLHCVLSQRSSSSNTLSCKFNTLWRSNKCETLWEST